MPNPIAALEQLTFENPDGADYRIEANCIPAGLPTNDRVRDRFDDRTIGVPKALGSVWFEVWDPHEALAAHATFAAEGQTVQCDGIEVEAPHRRQGIATTLYQLASEIFAAPVIPAQVQTADAKLFWNGRSQICWP